MTANNSQHLRSRLHSFGLAEAAIDAAWPRWWTDDAEMSTSARAELRFGVARKLGLDPRSLLEDADEPRFMWVHEARFKHLVAEDEKERAGITSFGRAVASALTAALGEEPAASLYGRSALALRQAVLAGDRPYVDLADLLAVCWGLGVPVAHLRVFPWPQKRMAAMTIALEGRAVVLLGKDANYPAPVAFYLAHEIGHIALGHVAAGETLIDLDTDDPIAVPEDDEEQAADAFALELLTGTPRPAVELTAESARASGRELARIAMGAAAELQIEPGTLALAFGYSTQDWRTANAALRQIYAQPFPVWQAVNRVAVGQLRAEQIPPDAADFLAHVLGLAALA